MFKIIGVAGGWLWARWEGAVAGLILGSMADEYFSGSAGKTNETYSLHNIYSTGAASGFNYSLLALTAAVMQSDGKTTRSELEYARNFFIRQFGAEKTQESLLLLRDMLKQNVPLEVVCSQVRQNMSYGGKVQLMQYLFGIAYADSVLSAQEETLLNRVAQMIGVGMADFMSVGAMFTPKSNGASYQVLGINANATDDEIKKAYRQMALQSHPDRVSYLGEDVRKAAEERFKKIQAAYEDIKRVRGFA